MDGTNNFNMYSNDLNNQSSSAILMDENAPVGNDLSDMFIDPWSMENSDLLLPSTFSDDFSFFGDDDDPFGLMNTFLNDEGMNTQAENPFNFNQEENHTTPNMYHQENVDYNSIPENHVTSANVVTPTTPTPTLNPVNHEMSYNMSGNTGPAPIPMNHVMNANMVTAPAPAPATAPNSINCVMSDNMVTAPVHIPINHSMSANMFTATAPTPVNRVMSANMVTAPINHAMSANMVTTPAPTPVNRVMSANIFNAPAPNSLNRVMSGNMVTAPTPAPAPNHINRVMSSNMVTAAAPNPINGVMSSNIVTVPAPRPINHGMSANMVTPPVPIPINRVMNGNNVKAPAPNSINRVMNANMVTTGPAPIPMNRVMSANNVNAPAPNSTNRAMSSNYVTASAPRLLSANIVTAPAPRLMSANITTAPAPTNRVMSSNITPTPAPSRTTRRGRPPLPRNHRQVEENVNVSQLGKKRPFPTPATQSPTLSNYNPYHKARYQAMTRPSSSNIQTSSNMNIGLMNAGGGASFDQQRINSAPQTLNQFEGPNELSNRSLFPGSFQNNIFRADHTEEEKLKLMLRNLPSWAASHASTNSSIMANTTSLNGHVGQNNLLGSNFNSGVGNQGNTFEPGSTSNTGILNQNNLFGSSSGSRTGIVNQNNLLGSTTTRSNQGIRIGSDSNSGSRTAILNQNNLLGSTTTLRNQANTSGMCINDNQPMPMFQMSHGSNYLQISSMYRDLLTMGNTAPIGKSYHHPRESNVAVENRGDQLQQMNNRGKEPMTLENNIREIGVSGGYNYELLIPEELPNYEVPEGYNCELLVPEEMPNDGGSEGYNYELVVPEEMPNENVPEPQPDENQFYVDPSFWNDENLDLTSIFSADDLNTLLND